MAQSPLHQCSRCRKLVRGKCPHCAAIPKPRTSPRDPFYGTYQWKQLRDRFIANNPLCKPCEDAGITTASLIADHILERADRPDLELDEENLQAMCLSCHSRKTRIEAARRRRGMGR